MDATAANKRVVRSRVEQAALAAGGFELIYPPTEKIPSIIVNNFPTLGKMTAMRFLEWAGENPEGVIALPTGKTPEFFIKSVQHYLANWTTAATRRELARRGLDKARKPAMRGLRFVQIDDFYPVEPSQTNSFNHYVKTYYLQGFGLDPKRAMLIDAREIGLRKGELLSEVWPEHEVDLSLRTRQAATNLERRQKDVLERVDQWCMEYEEKIRGLGGIGFFVGGIGPDGHIGFNIRGSDHHSTTRLCRLNYESMAAAATDLGGIETARKCLVITIGLETITANPQCVAIIMAAGQAKARIVADAIESEKDARVPGSALQALPNARFYLTTGAAAEMTERRFATIERQAALDDETTQRIVLEIAAKQRKRVLDLSAADFRGDRFGKLVLSRRDEPLDKVLGWTHVEMAGRLARGMTVLEGKRFLHTEPHHDDVMLGYFAHLVRHFRRATNEHHFMTLTSGFTSVTNDFMTRQLGDLRGRLFSTDFDELHRENYFDPANTRARNRDVWQYLDGIAERSEETKNQGSSRRLLRNLIEVYKLKDRAKISKKIGELAGYFERVYPGHHDPKDIQQLKGMCREWEAECLWGYYGWNCDNVLHLRLGFYTGDIFTPQPTAEKDVMPIVKQFETIKPDILTVAFDPEGSGPDTHYKVLQVLAEALRIYQERSGRDDIRIWGYRNVWYRFDPAEANIHVPVSLCMFSVAQQAFMNSFISQREASFPSHDYEGPFSELAQKIQVQQYQTLKTALGRDFFYNNQSPLIRATRGIVFLKEMDPETFYDSCRRLRRSLEAFDTE